MKNKEENEKIKKELQRVKKEYQENENVMKDRHESYRATKEKELTDLRK
jgi:hypothetical protein